MGLEYHAMKRAETERSVPYITLPLNVDADLIVKHILKLVENVFPEEECIQEIYDYCTELNTSEDTYG